MSLTINNPANGQQIAQVPSDDEKSIQSKLDRFALPKEQPLFRRIQVVRQFRDLLKANIEGCAQILTQETGKPLAQSKNELKACEERINFFTDHVEKVMETDVVLEQPGLKEEITYDPLGNIANISAWNFPYFVSLNVLIPAYLTGCSSAFKPSEIATLSGQKMCELLWEAGVSHEHLALIVGGGEVGTSLLRQPWDGVFFTGSVATGRKISSALAGQFTKLSMELGGKDPVYVTEDVDIEGAAAGIMDGAMYNAGQSCCSVERVYIHEKIYDQFVEACTSVVSGFQIGDPMAEDTYIGPLARSEQVEILSTQVEDALAKGGRLLVGGKARHDLGPNYFEPTLISNANHKMDLMHAESFGPIIGLQKVSSDHEAVGFMNDTRYGLTAGVFGKDQERAERILGRLQSGTAYWNCCDRVSPRLPWSGRRESGVGTTLSTHGILSFLKPRAWHWKSV